MPPQLSSSHPPPESRRSSFVEHLLFCARAIIFGALVTGAVSGLMYELGGRSANFAAAATGTPVPAAEALAPVEVVVGEPVVLAVGKAVVVAPEPNAKPAAEPVLHAAGDAPELDGASRHAGPESPTLER